MSRKPVPRRVLSLLVALAIVLTISLSVILGLASVIGKMGDVGGQYVLQWIALGIGVLWAIDAICLILALGVNAMTDAENPPDEPY